MHTSIVFLTTAAIAFFWCGSVVAISFLEAWLKFKAPGVTIEIGLGIGRLVFKALNRMEWVLAAACIALQAKGSIQGWLLVAMATLAIETIWLLPALDKRAVAYIAGKPAGRSTVHLAFVAAELTKVVSLAVAGITILNLI